MSVFDIVGDPVPAKFKGHPQAELWSPEALANADIPEPEAFIGPDVASRGTITLFAGRRGAGKTYLLLRLAASIALGGSFGDLSCRVGRVLFLSQEMGLSAIKKRVVRLFSPQERAELEGKLDLCCKLHWKLESEEGLQPLISLLDQTRPDVIIVDALRDIKGSAKENDNDEMGEAFVRFRDLVCERFNLSGIMNHHKGKPNADGVERGSRGASSIEDVSADVLYVTKTDSGRHIDFEKTRDGSTEGKRLDFAIAEDPDDPARVSLDITEGTSASDASFELNKLYQTLERDGSSLFSLEDVSRLMSWAERTSRRYVASAKEAGRMVNTTRPPAKALYRYIPLSSPVAE